jgi:hypothetical protein
MKIGDFVRLKDGAERGNLELDILN